VIRLDQAGVLAVPPVALLVVRGEAVAEVDVEAVVEGETSG
jgi:hypothetical protein